MKASERNEFLDGIKHGGMNSLLRKALELGIKVESLKKQPKVIKLRYAGRSIYIRSGSIPVKRTMGQFTKNKSLTKDILADAKISVPKGIVVEKYSDIERNIIKKNKLKFPLIVKPQGSSRAKGVTWNINSLGELEKAVRKAAKVAKWPFLVEEMFIGEEYRILVFNNKVIAVVHKVPPTIYGDGESTAKQLIEKYNLNRAPEKKLKIDSEVKRALGDAGYNLKSVIPEKEKLKLKNTFLMAEGAKLLSANKSISPYYKDICQKSVSILNLQLGGIDIITKDISNKSEYVVLEVNPNPFYNMHEEELVEGSAVDVSKIILQDLFPELKAKK